MASWSKVGLELAKLRFAVKAAGRPRFRAWRRNGWNAQAEAVGEGATAQAARRAAELGGHADVVVLPAALRPTRIEPEEPGDFPGDQ